MAISQVSLSSAARQNLTALQNTSDLLETTEARLSSGKKVNSALDDAQSYFASQGFLQQATDLSSLKDSMSTALETIKAATDAIESIQDVIAQLQSIVNSALQSNSDTTRATYAAQYNALLTQLDTLAQDSTFNGTNLIDALGNQLKILFNADGSSNLTIASQNLQSSGLGVASAVGNFAQNYLAYQDTMSLTKGTSATTLTNATYSGTLSGLTVTGGAAAAGAGGGDDAVITSTSQDYKDGGIITSYNSAALATAALNSTTGLGQTGVTATVISTSTVNSGTASTVITGQFTATGGSAASFSATTNTLTAGATDDTGVTISVGVGQTVTITADDGAGAISVTRYTNNTAAAITFNCGTTTDTVSVMGSLSGGAANVMVSTAEPGDPGTGTDNVFTAGIPTTGAQVTATGTGAGASYAVGTTSISDAVSAGTLVASANTHVYDNSGGADTAQLLITGEFTYVTGATNDYIVVKAGQTIRVDDRETSAGGSTHSIVNYTNTSSDDLILDLGTTATSAVAAIGAADTYYSANSSVSYVLGSGTVSTTGVTLSNLNTLNGNALVDSTGVAANGSLTAYKTGDGTGLTEGTTSSSGITAYDVESATISAIGASGVRCTVSATGAETYAGSNLLVTLANVQTLTGSRTRVVDDAITIAQNELTAALSTLRSTASSLGTNNSLVQTRLDNTTAKISTLQSASDNLVLADTNEEGANLQALQAQSQLGVVALGVSGQQAQAILRLF